MYIRVLCTIIYQSDDLALSASDMSYVGNFDRRGIRLARHDESDVDEEICGIWYGTVDEERRVERVSRRLTCEIM